MANRTNSKLKHTASNFILTVNSNSTVTKDNNPKEYKRLKKAFHDGLSAYITNIDKYLKFMEYGIGAEALESVNLIKAAYEWGSDKGTFHIHYALTINHHTRIQIDGAESRKFWSNYLFGGTKNIHFDYGYKRSGEEFEIAVEYIGRVVNSDGKNKGFAKKLKL